MFNLKTLKEEAKKDGFELRIANFYVNNAIAYELIDSNDYQVSIYTSLDIAYFQMFDDICNYKEQRLLWT